MLETIKQQILSGHDIDKKTALSLLSVDLKKLTKIANEIRQHFCSNDFDLCSIVNGKSGKCSEDCKFCAQSIRYQTNIETYPLVHSNSMVEEAKHNYKHCVQRFSIVTSGRYLSTQELEKTIQAYQNIKRECPISLCASHGLLEYEQLVALKQAGVTRYHNNLETSRNYFPIVCSSHSYDDKIETIIHAKKAGLEICSGGIMGLGESFEDRIDLAFTLKELNVQSIPINFLSPIKNTPFETNTLITLEEAKRIIAIFRFIHPQAIIRLAGGRNIFDDKGFNLFTCGANGTITGDMLTTTGITIKEDIEHIKQLGYQVKIV